MNVSVDDEVRINLIVTEVMAILSSRCQGCCRKILTLPEIRSRLGIKSPKIWRRILRLIQGVHLGALKYVPKGATKKKAKKASHMRAFILIMGLKTQWLPRRVKFYER